MFAKGYNSTLVHEFYSNLTPSIKTPTTKGYHHVFVRGEIIEFTSEIEDVYEDGFEFSDEVLKEITGEKYSSWGPESRFLASPLTVKYNVLFRLGIYNWFPMAHNSSIFKEMTLLPYDMVTGRKFNLGKFIFEKIVEEAGNNPIATHLSYPVFITQYLLQHSIQYYKPETLTVIKKLKISQKLFAYGKNIDLLVRRVSSLLLLPLKK